MGGDAGYTDLVRAAHPHPPSQLWSGPYLEIISGLSSDSCLEMLMLKALPLLTQYVFRVLWPEEGRGYPISSSKRFPLISHLILPQHPTHQVTLFYFFLTFIVI